MSIDQDPKNGNYYGRMKDKDLGAFSPQGGKVSDVHFNLQHHWRTCLLASPAGNALLFWEGFPEDEYGVRIIYVRYNQ